jgi:hypothetical protein
MREIVPRIHTGRDAWGRFKVSLEMPEHFVIEDEGNL